MEELHINYHLQDYIDANVVWMKSHPSRSIRQAFFLLMALFFGGIGILFLLANDTVNVIISFLFFAFSLCWAFYEKTILPFLCRQRFTQQKMYFSEEIILWFDENLIRQNDAVSDFQLKWIYKQITTPDMLLIFTTPLNFIFIPRKYCVDFAQYQRICNIVAEFPHGDQ